MEGGSGRGRERRTPSTSSPPSPHPSPWRVAEGSGEKLPWRGRRDCQEPPDGAASQAERTLETQGDEDPLLPSTHSPVSPSLPPLPLPARVLLGLSHVPACHGGRPLGVWWKGVWVCVGVGVGALLI